MDQIKIGKFIAQLRKEKKLTQMELGEILGVSNKAVSKWENGRCLPDPSLYGPLCETLGIALTELFSGERIPQEEALEKSDKVLHEVLQRHKAHKVMDLCANILITVAVIMIFLPILNGFERTRAILTVALGLFSLLVGFVLKLLIWQTVQDKRIENTGMGFSSALTVLFVAFKLLGYIDWPWIWVFSPLWIMGSLLLLLLGGLLVVAWIKGRAQSK